AAQRGPMRVPADHLDKPSTVRLPSSVTSPCFRAWPTPAGQRAQRRRTSPPVRPDLPIRTGGTALLRLARRWVEISLGRIAIQPPIRSHHEPAGHLAFADLLESGEGSVHFSPGKGQLIVVDGVQQLEYRLVDNVRDQLPHCRLRGFVSDGIAPPVAYRATD